MYYVYILTNKKNGTLYIGVTNDLLKRVWEHKQKSIQGFTNTYNTDRLVYFEETADVRVAIQREKRLKKWNRQWKINLIEELNPEWKDLYSSLLPQTQDPPAKPWDDSSMYAAGQEN